jgi:copper transporter 1
MKLCSSTSAVKDCAEHKGLDGLPTTKQIRKQVSGICDSHFMGACGKCNYTSSPKTCDYLEMLVEMCQQMPYMEQCQQWHSLCNNEFSKDPFKSHYCLRTENKAPEMRMFFHTGYEDFVLFYDFVPRDGVQYAFTCIFVLFLGVLYEFIHLFRISLQSYWIYIDNEARKVEGEDEVALLPQNTCCCAVPKPPVGIIQYIKDGAQPFKASREFKRAGLRFFELLLSFSLMLIAMTFNVGLFFCVLFGHTLGIFIFARYGQLKVPDDDICC